MTNEEAKKAVIRAEHYIKLGFTWDELDGRLLLDDQRWEQAKCLPINPSNPLDSGEEWYQSLTPEEKRKLSEMILLEVAWKEIWDEVREWLKRKPGSHGAERP